MLTRLHHFSIRLPVSEMTASVDFYTTVLGLADGPRPPFPFPGHWLYSGDWPVVHLIGLAENSARHSGEPLDHVAFAAEGYQATCEMLKGKDIEFRERYVPESGAAQIFLTDPHGITIELLFKEADGEVSGLVFGESDGSSC